MRKKYNELKDEAEKKGSTKKTAQGMALRQSIGDELEAQEAATSKRKK